MEFHNTAKIVPDRPDSDPTYPKWLFIAGILLTLLITLLYGLFLRLFLKRRNMQPLKSKAPELLLMSFLGNLASSLAVCGVITLGCSGLFGRRIVIGIIHIGNIVSEVIAFPILITPYIFRYVCCSSEGIGRGRYTRFTGWCS